MDKSARRSNQPELIYKALHRKPAPAIPANYRNIESLRQLGAEIRESRKHVDISLPDAQLVQTARSVQGRFWWAAMPLMARNQEAVTARAHAQVIRDTCRMIDSTTSDVSLATKVDTAAAPQPGPAFDASNLGNATVFCISEITEYLEALGLHQMDESRFTQAQRELEGIAVALPFEDCFFEWKWSRPVPGGPVGGAVLLKYQKVRDALDDELIGDAAQILARHGKSQSMISYQYLADYGGKALAGPVAMGAIELNEDHSLGSLFGSGPWFVEHLDQPHTDLRSHAATMGVNMMPVLFALMYMSCRNVKLVEQEAKQTPMKSKQVRRDAAKEPFEKYYVLDVAALRPVLEKAREAGPGSQIEAALHGVRAHPKTFTKDKPLLGKHVGTFVWKPQVRGNPERGVVTKDYNVTMPSGGSEL